jgi:hypothetical protein
MVSMIRQHSGAGVVAAAVIAGSLPNGLFDPGAYAAAGIGVWALLIPGLIGRILPVASVGRSAALAGMSIAAIAALATLSVAWAADQGRAFDEATRAWVYLGLFVLAASTASGRGRREWVTGLTIGLVVVAVIALFAYLQPGFLESGSPEVASAAGRLSYPIGYWNGIASMVAAAVVLLAFWGTRARSLQARCVAVAVMPLALLCIWLTDSRGGLVAVIAGSIVLVAAGGHRRRQLVVIALGVAGALVLIGATTKMDALTDGLLNGARRSEGDGLSALVLLVTAATGLLAWWADGWWPAIRINRRTTVVGGWVAAAVVVIGLIAWNPIARFNEFREPPTLNARAGVTELSSHGRWQFWSIASHAFESHPIAGVGAGGFEEYWARHGTIERFVRNPHSLLMQQAAELGVIGLIPLFGLLASIGAAAWVRLSSGRTRDSGVLAAVVVSGAVGAAVDWTWQIPAVVAPALICAALLASSAQPRLLTGGGRRLGLMTLVTGWAALAAACLVAIGELELSRSRDAADAGHLETAANRARDARAVEPWSGAPYTQLALIEERRRNYDLALAYLKAAEARDSGDWRLPLIEARIQFDRGADAAARRAVRRGRALSPSLLGSRRRR